MFCACTGGPVCGSLLEFWLIYIYTFIVYNYLYDILNDIIIIVIYSSWTLRIVLHPDTKEMNVWHFEMLNASGHVQYVVENISGCLGCMGVDRWPCQVLCHRMSEVIVVEFCIHVLHGLRVPSVALAFLCMFFWYILCIYNIYIICIYIHTCLHTHEVHTILIIKPGTWHRILANHFKCFRFPVANASLENISQAEAAVIGPAYNNMSFLVVAAKNPSLDFKGFVLLYQFTGRPPPVEVFFIDVFHHFRFQTYLFGGFCSTVRKLLLRQLAAMKATPSTILLLLKGCAMTCPSRDLWRVAHWRHLRPSKADIAK